MRTFAFALAAAAATSLTLVAAPAAFAADGAISWKGLDLTTDAGRAALDSRIDTAARELCTVKATTGTMLSKPAKPACIADARTQIQAKLATKLPATAFAQTGSSTLASNSEAR